MAACQGCCQLTTSVPWPDPCCQLTTPVPASGWYLARVGYRSVSSISEADPARYAKVAAGPHVAYPSPNGPRAVKAIISELGHHAPLEEGMPLQRRAHGRRPRVAVRLSEAAAALEQARMTRDCSIGCSSPVRLTSRRTPARLQFCSPRAGGALTNGAAPPRSTQRPATRLCLPYLAFQLGCQRSLSRRGGCFLWGAPTPWQAVEERAFAPQSLNLIVNCRCVLVGLDATEFAAQSLRSAHLRLRARGVPLLDTLRQRQHRSVQ